MDPQAANRLIQTQPQKADAQAREWNVFASQHPEISHFVLKQEFDAWARTHGVSDTSIWFGKEIQEEYFHLRLQHEEEQIETQGQVDYTNVPTGLATLVFLSTVFSRERPRIMEEDPDFKRILKEKAKTWLDDHPDKDVTSKEWIDYRYGSLENPNAPTLYSQTEEAFRPAYEKRAKTYDEERKKIYSDPNQDQAFIWRQEEVKLHAETRHEFLKKQDSSLTIEHVQKQVEIYHWEQFVEKHEEKAKVYAEKHEGIKSAVSRIEERKKQTAAPKIETRVLSTIPDKKDIRAVENKLHRPPDISIEEASKRMQQAVSQQPPTPPKDVLVDTQGHFSVRITQPSQYMQQTSPPAPPAPRTPPGGAGQGNVPRPPSNPLSGLGSTLARTRLLVNPLFVIIGVVVITFIFTLITIIAGPATIGEASPETGSGVLDYTIPFRDISILPTDPDAAKEAVKREFPRAQLQYWDKIVEQSRVNGWNPAFVLALWIEETGASHCTKTSVGGGNVVCLRDEEGNPLYSNGHLGCIPGQDQTIDRSLQCLFLNFGDDFTATSQFEAFMRRYSGEKSITGPFTNNQYFPERIKRYYSLLVPSGAGAVIPIAVEASRPIIPTGQGGERIASAAKQIAEQLVYSGDVDALQAKGWNCNLSGTFGPSFHCWVPNKMVRYDQGGNTGYLECTEFVWAVFAELGPEFEKAISLIKSPDAYRWVEVALQNPEAKKAFDIFYEADQLQQGDIISAGEGYVDGQPWGHVAVVTAKYGKRVQIAQASTVKSIEEWYIDETGTLVSPFKSKARSPIRGFFRLKTL